MRRDRHDQAFRPSVGAVALAGALHAATLSALVFAGPSLRQPDLAREIDVEIVVPAPPVVAAAPPAAMEPAALPPEPEQSTPAADMPAADPPVLAAATPEPTFPDAKPPDPTPGPPAPVVQTAQPLPAPEPPEPSTPVLHAAPVPAEPTPEKLPAAVRSPAPRRVPAARPIAAEPSSRPDRQGFGAPPQATPPSPAEPSPAAPSSAAEEATLEARIREAVQAAVHYPAAARMMGLIGRARVQLDYRGGAVTTAALAQSAGASILDDAALGAVRSAHYPPPSPRVGERLLRLLVWVGVQAVELGAAPAGVSGPRSAGGLSPARRRPTMSPQR